MKASEVHAPSRLDRPRSCRWTADKLLAALPVVMTTSGRISEGFIPGRNRVRVDRTDGRMFGATLAFRSRSQLKFAPETAMSARLPRLLLLITAATLPG